MAERTILFTGFPGFIGTRLIPRLLTDDPDARVVALVEPRMVERARSAAASIGPRVSVQPGDITDPRLGLDQPAYDRLAAETTSVFHLAAVYDLAVGAALAERVNVSGTQHIVEFTRRCTHLERHNYVSTAYVAGNRSGLVREEDLDAGQSFKNHYESTKFAAEVLVRNAMQEVPTTIYRPAIVVGDSRTGETQKFDGPYYMLRAIGVSVRRHMPIAQYGHGAAPFNVVPVDFIVNGLLAGSVDEQAVGKTFHLVDPEPITAREVFTLLSELYAGKPPAFTLPAKATAAALHSRRMRKMFDGVPAESIRYLNHPVRYDARHASDLMERHGLRLPRFPEYAEPMVRFFREHEDDPVFAPAT
jgi:thioester reductase-like protein